MAAIEFAAALSLAEGYPISSAITSAFETIFLNKGFQENRLIIVAVLPVRR